MGTISVVLRLQYLKYQIRGSTLLPYFLTFPKDQALPQRLIEYLENQLGKHKGKIEVDSEPNIGTTFTIYLEATDEKKD